MKIPSQGIPAIQGGVSRNRIFNNWKESGFSGKIIQNLPLSSSKDNTKGLTHPDPGELPAAGIAIAQGGG